MLSSLQTEIIIRQKNFIHWEQKLRVFIAGQALGKLTGCEDNFACLVWPSSRKFFL